MKGLSSNSEGTKIKNDEHLGNNYVLRRRK